MKKIMSLLVVCSFVVTIFAGCSSNTNSGNTNGNTNGNTSNTTNTTNTTPAVNTIGNTAGNLNSGGTAAQQDDWIYYSRLNNSDNGGGLYKLMML
jgi:hypothetical protein